VGASLYLEERFQTGQSVDRTGLFLKILQHNFVCISDSLSPLMNSCTSLWRGAETYQNPNSDGHIQIYTYMHTKRSGKSKSHYNWQSVSMSRYQAHLGTCDQILLSVRRLFSEICCLVSVGRPLWWEVRPVICLSQSSNLPVFTSNIYITCVLQFSILYTI
jgi:hypothetical protein